jgi:hypothetical protein
MKRVQLAGYVLALATLFMVCPAFESVAWAEEVLEEVEEPEVKKESTTLKSVLSYGLSLAGFAVIAALVVHTLSKTMRYPEARHVLVHLLRTNPNQAEYQCYLVPHTFYEPIGAALKTGGMAQTTDLKMLQTATLPTYDAIAGVVSQHWKGLVGKAKLAMMAVVGGLVIAITKGGFPVVITIIAVLSVGGLLWLFAFKADIERSILRARVEILPEVERALVEGRYLTAPPA